MNGKLAIKTVLVVFALVLAGAIAWKETGLTSAAPGEVSASPTAPPKVIAYYFHMTYRCSTCLKIEAYSREAIESAFAKELKDGSVEWRVINVEEWGNRHYIDDYRLFTKSLVLVRMSNGKQKEWKNLLKVWQLVRNKEVFLRYVQGELRSYLEAS